MELYGELLKRVEQIEKAFGSLEEYVLLTTFEGDEHRMKMEEAYAKSAEEMTQVYQDLSVLELADLFDAQNLIGRFDGDSC